MSSNYIEQPRAEGQTKECHNCKNPLIGRLKVYKDWPDKIQWQDIDKTESHYDKDGNCKGTQSITAPKEEPTQTTTPQAEPKKEDTKPLEKAQEISIKARVLWRIRLQVEATVRDLEATPNGGMIWEMTKIIYQELYGDKK